MEPEIITYRSIFSCQEYLLAICMLEQFLYEVTVLVCMFAADQAVQRKRKIRTRLIDGPTDTDRTPSSRKVTVDNQIMTTMKSSDHHKCQQRKH